MKAQRILITVLLLGVATVLAGCSTVYRQQWRRAATEEPGSHPVEGRWEGTWLSHKNQHTGKLRCIVTAEEPGRYDFHYWATWGWFAGTYHLNLDVTDEDGRTRLAGEKNLGKMAGGIYRFTGTVESNQFLATYQSRWDDGEFRLVRAED